MSENESFFRVFDYSHMMHDAIDGGLTYEIIKIRKDIKTKSGFELKIGKEYETCYFIFGKAEFQFINWIPSKDNPGIRDPDPQNSITIPQDELAPFLIW